MGVNTNITMPRVRYVVGTIEDAKKRGGYWLIRYTPQPPRPQPTDTNTRSRGHAWETVAN